MSDFKVVVITDPGHVADEAAKIGMLLNCGVDYVHVRKPDWSLREVKNLIEDIPYGVRKRLKLHGHFELLHEMNLGGAHLNQRNKTAPYTAINVTRSCHTLEELKDISQYEYVTLSPIFDSISKSGYLSRFNLDNLSEIVSDKDVIALGGVSPDKFLLLRQKGFSGAALLGYIWSGDFAEKVAELKRSIDSINKQSN